MSGGPVGEDETLYRCVRSAYYKEVNGTLRVSESGFLDREKKPSVNRAKLHDHDPGLTKRDKNDAVARLETAEVRAIKGVDKKDRNGVVLIEYRIDVEADPIKNDPILPDNAAHARICADLELGSSAFEKLREELSDLAVIVLGPE